MYHTNNCEHEVLMQPKKIRTILLVEDDRMVSSLIKSSLEKSGYMVSQIYRGDKVLEEIAKNKPDLILLDLGLPGLNGFHVCQQARETFKGPIIILSAKSHEDEQLLAFNLGADDYIIKPVTHSILKVRIEALLRRQPIQNIVETHLCLKAGDIELFPQANKCLVNKNELHLSSFEFKLLGLLLRNVGRVMSRDSIYSLLMGREYNGVERTVDVRISKLRDKLTTQGMLKAKIETVWGAGYILNEL